IRSSERTRIRSSVRLIGLVRKSSAPESSACLCVPRSPSAVRNSTGVSPTTGSIQIGPLFFDHGESLFAVFGLDRLVAGAHQVALRNLPVLEVVVDDQDPDRR